jgi:integrase
MSMQRDPSPTATVTVPTALLGDLDVPRGTRSDTEIRDLAARAAHYAVRARGAGTIRAYRTAWSAYATWCRSLGREPLSGDPEVISWWITKLADGTKDVDGTVIRPPASVSTIRVALAAIAAAHRLAGVPLDTRDARLTMVVQGITRTKGARPKRRAAPATALALRLMADAQPSEDTAGARNRALLLLGYGAALRRSELVALNVGDLELVEGRGVRVLIRRSKTDQGGEGHEIGVWASDEPAFCAVRALESWLSHRLAADDARCSTDAMRRELPLFTAISKARRVLGRRLSDQSVNLVLKQAASTAGLSDPGRFSGHSLRAGLATQAGEDGADLAAIMRQTRHRSTKAALAYVRPAEIWRSNVSRTAFRAAKRTTGTEP